jgi:hypothetical protein
MEMLTHHKSARVAVATALTALCAAWSVPSEARVTRIVIDRTAPLAADATYETITGRAFGELDPAAATNSLITDIERALNANGKATYVASFFIVKPVDMTKSSGLMWHDVPNRGGRITITSDLRALGDIGLSSAWQGDNSGNTVVPANAESLTPVTPSNNEWVKVPVLTGVDVQGRIFGRIVNRDGTNQPLNVQNAPLPYFPANSADNSGATLTEILHETVNGVVTVGDPIPNSDWKFCYGAGATFAAPGAPTALPVRICLGAGRSFDPAKLYQVVYTAKDPYVLGVGTAAFRDLQSFFRYESRDDFGTPNPLAAAIKWAIIRGSSQSGNFTRHFIHLGMNQDEMGRVVHEGAWPLIAGRRVANNSRWGQPDGVLELYQMGSEGPQWWHRFPDHARGLPPRGILDRCQRSGTCPKIVETFGSAEVYALKMTTSWVGTDPKSDIPLPDNVRRYYLPSSTHGGGSGAMNENPPDVETNRPDNLVNCPGNNFGHGTLRANPVPSTQLVNRLRLALRDWVMHGTPPPPSRWPLMRGPKGERTLVEATKQAMGFPDGIPEIKYSIFDAENFIFPVFDYDWGPDYDHSEASGVPTNAPPPIRRVIKMMVPKVNADGNELGGVPTVHNEAPLGTYLGWNVTAGPGEPGYNGRPFHKGQVCDYVGGMVPFAKTKQQRLDNGDPRLSLEERYGTHEGYVAAVKQAADNAACQGYLLAGAAAAAMGAKCTTVLPAGIEDGWATLVNRAIASNVCNQPGDGGKCAP